jgi:photosystem II stability/assembly factor-like uncharacterized protein
MGALSMESATTTLLIGTTKGVFLLSDTGDRQQWNLTGPHCDGWGINHMAADPQSGELWAGGGGDWHGAGVWHSADGGNHWELTRLTRGTIDDWAARDADFAESIGWSADPLPFTDEFIQIWSLCFAHGKLYAGIKPAGLLVSEDRGKTWQRLHSLNEHPSASTWNPGGAGLILHTIVPHPQHRDWLWVGISAAGVFATEDGGQSWERRNRLSNTQVCEGHAHPAAPSGGEVGHCVHNMVRAQTSDELLYQQNHHGVWRSKNGGRSWDDITSGLPSTFGFPIHVHPHNSEVLWTIPLNGDDAGRFPPDASAAVWCSRDAGETWTAQRDGLPQKNCYFTVLRQAMCGDSNNPAGVFFGTNSGSIFATANEGEQWHEIARHLPTILSVDCLSRDA